MWNSLPNDLVNAPSMNSFKNRLDTFWDKQPINSFKNRLDTFWDKQPVKYNYEEPYLYGTGLKLYLAEEN